MGGSTSSPWRTGIVCRSLDFDTRSTRRTCGASTAHPRKTHSSRKIRFGRTRHSMQSRKPCQRTSRGRASRRGTLSPRRWDRSVLGYSRCNTRAVSRTPFLGGQVKSGHLWTPQIRPFPASRDGSLRFTSWRPVLARLSESPAFAASAATPDRARRAHAPTARRASGVKASTAGTSPSRPGGKAHNCSLSGGAAGVSPARAEA